MRIRYSHNIPKPSFEVWTPEAWYTPMTEKEIEDWNDKMDELFPEAGE